MGDIFTLENKKRPGAGGVLPPLGVGPGNTIGFEPMPSGPWDWNFGRPFSETDAKWRFTALLPQHPDQLWRGDQWGDSGFAKYLVKSGRLLLQTPYDGQQYYIGDYALDVSATGEDAVALNDFSFDGSENGGPASFIFAWGQSSGSGLDLNNCALVQLAEYGVGKWFVSFSIIQGGGGNLIYADNTYYDLGGCPFHAVGMHYKAGEIRAYVGNSIKSMMRLGVTGLGFSPDIVALFVQNANKPNDTMGLGAFLRRDTLTF